MSLQKFKDDLALSIFGMTKDECLKQGVCIDCKKEALPRCTTELGRKEYPISGLCEVCWDKLFV